MTETIDISRCSCGKINIRFGCAVYHVNASSMYALLTDIGHNDPDVLHNALVMSLESDLRIASLEQAEKSILLRFGMNLVELNRNQLLDFILKCWKTVPEMMHRIIAKSIDHHQGIAWMA